MVRLLVLALTLAATPAYASSYYRAELAVAPADARLVLRDSVWRCGGSSCAGTEGSSRPMVVCSLLARQVGKLRSYHSAGKPFSSEELDKCNARVD